MKTPKLLLAIAPGRIDLPMPGTSDSVTIRVHCANVFRGEAAVYERFGLPVPTQVLEDADRWEREHDSN